MAKSNKKPQKKKQNSEIKEDWKCQQILILAISRRYSIFKLFRAIYRQICIYAIA